MPRVAASQMMNCDEMMQEEQMVKENQVPDRDKPCENMSLDCLVAMNCVPPLIIGDVRPADAPVRAIRASYGVDQTIRLEARSLPPESPPPQILLNV